MISFAEVKLESTPALLLDLDAFDANCREIAAKANGKKLRIATKSIRSVPVLQRILQSDPVYQGLMCFTAEEALFLYSKGFDDILLGYPCWDKAGLGQIAKHNQAGKKIICMVDCAEQIDYLENIAQGVNGVFYICIDIDMSTSFAGFHFGVRRSPLRKKEEVASVAKKAKDSKYVQLTGIMGYEAQIAGVGDQAPGQFLKNKAVGFLKRKSYPVIENRRKEMLDSLTEAGFSLSLINGGGTGSMRTTAKEDAVTEVTVGSGFYAPHLFDSYRDFRYEPALFFALPIVRMPAKHMYTCLGGGYVASGPAGKDKIPLPVYPEGAKLLAMEAAGEVQTPIYYNQAPLKLGDHVIFRASKAGEICERFTEIVCLSKSGEIVGSYKTYRGEEVCFL